MLTHHIFSTAIALSTLTPSFSYTCTFTHLQMSSAASPLSNALRRSSRLRTSPYFNGGSFAAPVITPQFLASSDRGALDDVGEPEAQEDQPKRKDDSIKPTKKTSSSKSKASSIAKASTTTERTQSFEPAWWGNILANPTHTTLSPAKSTPTKRKPINYPPVHTLILGTHPSIASLSKNQFYGHPQNSFWYLVGDALHFRRCEAVSPSTYKPYIYFYEHLRYGVEHVIEYEAQLERLVGHGFALWDIVRECKRKGSLDQDINEESPNPIKEFCEGSICDGGGRGVKRIVIANGTTGAKFFVKHFRDWFEEGGLVAAEDELSQRVFKTAMNGAKKAAGGKLVNSNKAIKVICLPGVSPAAAKYTYLEKREAWERGCFGPALADYEVWKKHTTAEITTTPKTRKRSAKDEESATKPARKASAGKVASPSPSKTPAIRIVASDIAALTPENDWVDLQVSPAELRPSATLTNGQCFNWMVVESDQGTESAESPSKQSAWGTHDAKEWIGPLQNRVLSIRETETTTLYRVLHGPTEGATDDLRKYFRLETPLAPLYKEWSKADSRLAKIAAVIPGCRILRQDPMECMFSFICSSNNNIPRITKMLSSFRQEYGNFMMTIPAQNGDDISLYSFPTLDSLAGATEEDLRNMGLGYRAKYMTVTRDLLLKCGGEEYLLNLRDETDGQIVQDSLTQFSGIGQKVADCIALFSLDQDDAIPVDVHVQHIASRDYDPTVLGSAKSLTPAIYKQVGDLFRNRFPSFAGWAHSLLFVAELPSFRGVLPADVVQEMDEWREHEQRKKQAVKKQKSHA